MFLDSGCILFGRIASYHKKIFEDSKENLQGETGADCKFHFKTWRHCSYLTLFYVRSDLIQTWVLYHIDIELQANFINTIRSNVCILHIALVEWSAHCTLTNFYQLKAATIFLQHFNSSLGNSLNIALAFENNHQWKLEIRTGSCSGWRTRRKKKSFEENKNFPKEWIFYKTLLRRAHPKFNTSNPNAWKFFCIGCTRRKFLDQNWVRAWKPFGRSLVQFLCPSAIAVENTLWWFQNCTEHFALSQMNRNWNNLFTYCLRPIGEYDENSMPKTRHQFHTHNAYFLSMTRACAFNSRHSPQFTKQYLFSTYFKCIWSCNLFQF